MRHHLKISTIGLWLSAAAIISGISACDDKKSYADLLTDETHAVNNFLANHKVENSIPADTIFETGPDAPYYRLDEDGNIYMQVLKPGDRKNNKVEDNELIYFRYTRYNLTNYMKTGEMYGEGNANNMGAQATSFRFGNYQLTSSSQYGAGVQMPLAYLGVDCEVNIVIKSQYGLSSEESAVVPFMWNIRYFRSPL